MAILTRAGMEKLLRRLFETGGLTPDMEEDIKRLKDDFDEREGILRKYGEVYDGEDRDDYDYRELERRGGDNKDTDVVYTPREEEKDWEKRYNELKDRYIARFLGKSEEVLRKAEKEAEIPDEYEDISVEDLFERVK